MTDSTVFVHPTAIVDDGVCIGSGTKIWHWTHISSGAHIGDNCSFGQNVYIGNDVIIGNNVRVQNNVSIYTCVVLEDDVFCGPSMVFTNDLNPRAHISKKEEWRATVVKKGASIGANATIVCGNTIFEYAFIGAGCVVTKDVPAHALMIGNPARKIGWVCQCGQRCLPQDDVGTCLRCGQKYKIAGGEFKLAY